jgi:hypothetical protein
VCDLVRREKIGREESIVGERKRMRMGTNKNGTSQKTSMEGPSCTILGEFCFRSWDGDTRERGALVGCFHAIYQYFCCSQHDTLPCEIHHLSSTAVREPRLFVVMPKSG